MRSTFLLLLAVASGLCLALLAPSGSAQQGKAKPVTVAKTKSPKRAIPDADWPDFNRDPGSSRYSPLKQITAANVAQLKETWTYTPPSPPSPIGADTSKAKAKGARGGIGAQVVPIVINGILYVTAGAQVIALDATKGTELWKHTLTQGNASTRGVTYWPGDGQNPPRILFTSGRNLVALNATTGALDPGFGTEGRADMGGNWSGVPTIFRNTIVVGATVLETPTDPNASGDTKAFDARTGKKTWEFHTVPRPGELGHETWLNDGWKDRSGTNIWAWHMSVDEQLGLIYLPIDGPAANYYGGDRPGANLFGNSIVALDAESGTYRWHFQTVHHDLWDFDNPPAPVLLDITRNGQRIPVLAQVGKSGYMFILDRRDGKPIFGVEERPVPKGDAPGEWYSPTQPFPLKPPPLAKVDFKREDIVTAADTNETHAAACLALYEKSGGFYNAGPFTPVLFHEEGTPPKSTIVFPGLTGGTNWGGMAADPQLGYVFAYAQNEAQIGWIEKRKGPAAGYGFDAAQSNQEYDRASVDGPGPFHTFSANAGPGLGTLPCQRPPWGVMNAVNANTGDIAWQVSVGITEGLGPAKQNTGRSGGFAGPTATAGGVLFFGALNDGRFRAFDSRTGKELWTFNLGAAATAQPITYQGKNGKQYVSIVAAGTVRTFALP